MITRQQKEEAALADLRSACPKAQIEAWYDATGGPGTGKWRIRGMKDGRVVVNVQKEGFTPALTAFRDAYKKAVDGNLL